MLVHNFFSDILLSIRTLFENYLFDYKTEFFQNNVVEKKPKSFIQSYQYSLGNRNYMIGDYKQSAQLEFPTAIITLSTDESAFGQQASLIGHHQISHINEIPVLYCEETRKTIYLREEQTMISLQAQINCESQLQAKEIEHQIKRFMPLNKFIQFLEFTSFIELPSRFINSTTFNPLRHDITNLFYRTDPQTGNPDYCFAISYKPLIKLNSCQADISDPSARSWPVSMDFSYHIQTPMWLYAEKDDSQPERINISFAMGGEWEPIVDTIQQWGVPLEFSNQRFKPRFSYIVRRESDITVSTSEDGSTSRLYITLPNTSQFKLQEIPLKLFRSPESIITTYSNLTSDISFDLDQTKNELCLNFRNNSYSDWTPSITKPLILQFLLPLSDEERLTRTIQKHMFDTPEILKEKY